MHEGRLAGKAVCLEAGIKTGIQAGWVNIEACMHRGNHMLYISRLAG
jgi:hypothetical protein